MMAEATFGLCFIGFVLGFIIVSSIIVKIQIILEKFKEKQNLFILKVFEYIIGILIIMFATVFTICGVGMVLAKDIFKKGDKKDE